MILLREVRKFKERLRKDWPIIVAGGEFSLLFSVSKLTSV